MIAIEIELDVMHENAWNIDLQIPMWKVLTNSKIGVGFYISITNAWQFGWNVNYKKTKHWVSEIIGVPFIGEK